MKIRWLSVGILSALAAPLVMTSQVKADLLVYVGTYTDKGGKGIYAYRLNPATGKVTEVGLAAEVSSPSFLAIHPNRKFVYAVSESDQGGAVSAFALDAATGKLKFLNRVSTKGSGPCHVSVDRSGRCAMIANYGSGSVEAFPIKADGSLGRESAFVQHKGSGADKSRQEGPHAHSINPSPDNRFAMAADLGLDKVLVYKLDPAKGTLTPNQPAFAAVPPGSGPRHFAFHPSGKFAYVINEMASTVTAFSYDAAAGVLTPIQTTSTRPKDYRGQNDTAEVQVHPNGKFLYGSNRGHDSIAVFTIDPAKGTLTPIGHASTQGRVPRNFGIDPSGTWLLAANQDTDNVAVFRIDKNTGKLTATGQSLKVSRPVCVKFVQMD